MWNIEFNISLDFVMIYKLRSCESKSLKLRLKIYFSITYYFMNLKTIDHNNNNSI